MSADASKIVHVPDCNEFDFDEHGEAVLIACGGVYVCPGCDRLCGWCFGARDNMPAVCDDCWARYGGDDDVD